MEQIGPYRIEGVLGAGGFGTVFLAADPVTGESVAVKVLDWPDDDWRRQMFRDEARALLAVQHPNVVRVRAIIDEPGLAAIVTDYVEGASLRAVLERDGQLTGPQALAVLEGALRGLAAVHAQGLVHADLKPDNILLDRAGSSRLIDFGLTSPARPLNGPDTWVGTPAYLAPEVVLGTHIDQRSDIYAAAVILFELLTGRQPYRGPTPTMTALLHVQSDIPDPRHVETSVSDLLASLTMRDLAKDPQLRHQRAPDFSAGLETAATETYGFEWRKVGAVAGAGSATGAVAALVAALLTTAPAGAGLLGAPPLVAGGAASALAGAATTTATTTAAGKVGALSTSLKAAVAGITATAAIGAAVTVVALNRDPEGADPAAAGTPLAVAAAYSADTDSGAVGGYVVTADGAVLPVEGLEGEGAPHFAVSPDQTWLAFSQRSTRTLALVSTLDPDRRLEMTCDCVDLTWGDDGTLWTLTAKQQLQPFHVPSAVGRGSDVTPQPLLSLDRSTAAAPAIEDTGTRDWWDLVGIRDGEAWAVLPEAGGYGVINIDLSTGATTPIDPQVCQIAGGAELSPSSDLLAYTCNSGATAPPYVRVVPVGPDAGGTPIELEPPAGGSLLTAGVDAADLIVVNAPHPASDTGPPAPRVARLALASMSSGVEELRAAEPPDTVWTSTTSAGHEITLRVSATKARTLWLDGAEIASRVDAVHLPDRVALPTDPRSAPTVADPDPPQATPSPTATVGSGEIIVFDPVLEVDGHGTLTGGTVPADFAAHLADFARALAASPDNEFCSIDDTWAEVESFDPAGKAVGSAGNACAGTAATTWQVRDGTWQSTTATHGF